MFIGLVEGNESDVAGWEEMKVMLPGGKVAFLRLSCKIVNMQESVVGLDSGVPFKGSHFVFLDYDNRKRLTEICMEFDRIINDNGYRRGIIVESSRGKYWGLIFAPTRYEKMLGILMQSSEDINHTRHAQEKGCSTIRMTLKKDGFVPRRVYVFENSNGTNFYNYKLEDVFMGRFERMARV